MRCACGVAGTADRGLPYYLYICIYIYREREREEAIGSLLPPLRRPASLPSFVTGPIRVIAGAIRHLVDALVLPTWPVVWLVVWLTVVWLVNASRRCCGLFGSRCRSAQSVNAHSVPPPTPPRALAIGPFKRGRVTSCH